MYFSIKYLKNRKNRSGTIIRLQEECIETCSILLSNRHRKTKEIFLKTNIYCVLIFINTLCHTVKLCKFVTYYF